jgi:hypothetical protein
MSLISQRGRRFRPSQREEMPTSLPSTPLVSRIGHGRGRTLITQLCAATTAEGPRSKADQIGGTAPPPVTLNANHVA